MFVGQSYNGHSEREEAWSLVSSVPCLLDAVRAKLARGRDIGASQEVVYGS